MQNDMLKNTISPWQEKGRWVKVTCESNKSEWSILLNESDSFFPDYDIVSSGIEVDQDYCLDFGSSEIDAHQYKIIDLKVLLPKILSDYISLYDQYFSILITVDSQYIKLCPPSQIEGKVVLYVYIYTD